MRVDMAAAACSVVIWGADYKSWSQSDSTTENDKCIGVPPGVLERLASAAGEEAVVVNQACDVHDLTLAWRELTACAISRVRAKADARQIAGASGTWSKPDTEAGVVTDVAAKASVADVAVSQFRKLDGRLHELQAKVTTLQEQAEASPIPLAFVTFNSSTAAHASWYVFLLPP